MIAAAGWALGFGVAILFVTFFFSPAKLVFKFAASPGWIALLIVGIVVSIIGLGTLTFAALQIEEEYDARAAAAAASSSPPPKTKQQERLDEYIARGYAEPEAITFEYNPEHEGPPPEVLPLSAQIISQKGKLDAEGIWTKKGAIVYENGVFVDFKIAVLFDDETWQRANSEHFEQRRRGRPVHIQNALDEQYIKAAVEGTHWVYCFGLASSDTDDAERNEKRSFDRAANLCRALANLEYIKPGRGIGLGLGYATTSSTDRRQLSRQRAAIIVGVTIMEKVRLTDLAASVANEIEVDGVLVDSYSRPITNPFVVRGIGKGAYNGIDGLSDADDDEEFWNIEPTEEKN